MTMVQAQLVVLGESRHSQYRNVQADSDTAREAQATSSRATRAVAAIPKSASSWRRLAV